MLDRSTRRFVPSAASRPRRLLRRTAAISTGGMMLTATVLAVSTSFRTEVRAADRGSSVAVMAARLAPETVSGASVTQGSVTLRNGTVVRFTAIAGLIPVGGSEGTDDALDPVGGSEATTAGGGNGSAVAHMSYVAYLAHGTDASRRPILFLYDGGPGSSSRSLLMASFSAVRVGVPQPGDRASVPAIPTIADNPDSLLDVADLVFIDAPGTGFGRIEGRDAAAAFYGIDGDAAAFAHFIERFRARFDRWTSPIYLFGHSYGTMRSAVLARLLSEEDDPPRGIISADQWLNADDFLDSGPANPGTDSPFVYALPTYAAIAWYHHRVPASPATLRPWLDQVEAFALRDYATALLAGSALPAKQEQAIAERLEQYTGIPARTWVEARLRIDGVEFRRLVLQNANQAVGRVDARYVAPVIDPLASDASGDAFGDAVGATIAAATQRYERDVLKLGPDHPFEPYADVPELRWNEFHSTTGKPWESFYNVMPDLAQAMTSNPTMRVLLIGGYYDLATTYLASLQEMRHLTIPGDMQANIETALYPTGHEPYVVDGVRRAMHDRIAHMIQAEDVFPVTGR